MSSDFLAYFETVVWAIGLAVLAGTLAAAYWQFRPEKKADDKRDGGDGAASQKPAAAKPDSAEFERAKNLSGRTITAHT
jgi:hypothetical protein